MGKLDESQRQAIGDVQGFKFKIDQITQNILQTQSMTSENKAYITEEFMKVQGDLNSKIESIMKEQLV